MGRNASSGEEVLFFVPLPLPGVEESLAGYPLKHRVVTTLALGKKEFDEL